MASSKLSTAFKNFANKISGTSYVDNMSDPTSAAYKMQQSVGKPNPKDPTRKPFKNVMTPNQKTYGIGVGP